MDEITATVLKKILMAAIDQAVALLLETSDKTYSKLQEIETKLDAIIIGDYQTACMKLRDAQQLSGDIRARTVERALELFELSANRTRHVLDAKRKSIELGVSAWAYGFDMRFPGDKRVTLEAKAYDLLNSHYPIEQAWIICLIGAYRSAREISDSNLVAVKRSYLENAIEDSGMFLRKKKDSLWEDISSWTPNDEVAWWEMALAGASRTGSHMLIKHAFRERDEETRRVSKRVYESTLSSLLECKKIL